MTTPDADPLAHPLDAPAAAGRLVAFRTVAAAMILGLGFWAAVVGLVVWFALDGQPIAGNAVQFLGVSVLTWFGVLVAVTAVPVALVVSHAATDAAVKRVAAEPPGDEAAETDKLLSAFAVGLFAESAIAEGAGVLCALLFHVTVDPPLMVAVGGLAAFLIFRFPTESRVRRWYDGAADRLARVRQESLG